MWCNGTSAVSIYSILYTTKCYSLLCCAHKHAHLLEVVGGVNAGFDLALLVHLDQAVHDVYDELRVQVAQVEAADGAVALAQAQGVNGELLVPGFSHGEQVLLLTRQHVGGTCGKRDIGRLDKSSVTPKKGLTYIYSGARLHHTASFYAILS